VGIATLLIPRSYEDAGQQEESFSYQAGTMIGQYRLLGLLGEGAIGRVYLAEHLELGRKVALKILRSEFAKNHSVVERFFGEARAVNQIHHENIVEITDFVRADESGRSYYIMELLDGMTLKQLLERIHVIPVPRALSIARQICSALEAVHATGIVHRDLKPENIFLSERGGKDFVKLLDFGAAKLSRVQDEKLSRFQTVAGALVGTPRYMAPEQTFGSEIDHRADVYALGVLLYEMLAGDTPFVSDNMSELLIKHRSERPPAPPAEAPEPVRALITRCLEKMPDARPKSMEEIGRVLDAELKRKRSRLPALALVLVALLGVGAAALYQLRAMPEVAAREAPPAPLPPAHVKVTFLSKPPGATVLVSRARVGETPWTAQVPRSAKPLAYELRLDGYATLADEVGLTSDSTVSVVLAEIPKQPRATPKRIKKKRVRPVKRAPAKKEIGLGDMRDPFSDK
jgi:serine/threonine-protein kinase